MADTFYIFDHALAPTPYNHRFFVEKFARGFGYRGLDVKVVSRLGEIREPGFVMVSNHGFLDLPNTGRQRLARFDGPAGQLRGQKRTASLAARGTRAALRALARRIRGRDIVLVAWFWNQQAEFINSLGVPVIFTGEYFYGRPASVDHQAWQDYYEGHENALPIRFSADADPGAIGTAATNDRFDVAYVGASTYKQSWYERFSGPRDRIVPTPPYIDEAERLAIYRGAKVVLGLHSDVNLANAVVVERVFEALAFGAVALTDHPCAPQATDGAALCVADADELVERARHFVDDDAAREAVRQQGFAFARNSGTYAHRADEFLALRRSLLG